MLPAATGKGRHLLVIAGEGAVTDLQRVVGMDWVLPVYPTGEAASFELRDGWPRLPAPETWTQAHSEIVVHLQVIQDGLETGGAGGPGCSPKVGEGPGAGRRDEVLRMLASMTALCKRFRGDPSGATGIRRHQSWCAPCQCCPHFEALGGQPVDLSCRSRLDPTLPAVSAGDRAATGAHVLAGIETLPKVRVPVAGPTPPREAVLA